MASALRSPSPADLLADMSLSEPTPQSPPSVASNSPATPQPETQTVDVEDGNIYVRKVGNGRLALRFEFDILKAVTSRMNKLEVKTSESSGAVRNRSSRGARVDPTGYGERRRRREARIREPSPPPYLDHTPAPISSIADDGHEDPSCRQPSPPPPRPITRPIAPHVIVISEEEDNDEDDSSSSMDDDEDACHETVEEDHQDDELDDLADDDNGANSGGKESGGEVNSDCSDDEDRRGAIELDDDDEELADAEDEEEESAIPNHEREPAELAEKPRSWQPPRPPTPGPSHCLKYDSTVDAIVTRPLHPPEDNDAGGRADIPASQTHTPEQLAAEAEQLLRELLHPQERALAPLVLAEGSPVTLSKSMVDTPEEDILHTNLPSIVCAVSPSALPPDLDAEVEDQEGSHFPKPRYTSEDIFGNSDDEDDEDFPKLSKPYATTIELLEPLSRRSPTPPAQAPTTSMTVANTVDTRPSLPLITFGDDKSPRSPPAPVAMLSPLPNVVTPNPSASSPSSSFVSSSFSAPVTLPSLPIYSNPSDCPDTTMNEDIQRPDHRRPRHHTRPSHLALISLHPRAVLIRPSSPLPLPRRDWRSHHQAVPRHPPRELDLRNRQDRARARRVEQSRFRQELVARHRARSVLAASASTIVSGLAVATVVPSAPSGGMELDERWLGTPLNSTFVVDTWENVTMDYDDVCNQDVEVRDASPERPAISAIPAPEVTVSGLEPAANTLAVVETNPPTVIDTASALSESPLVDVEVPSIPKAAEPTSLAGAEAHGQESLIRDLQINNDMRAFATKKASSDVVALDPAPVIATAGPTFACNNPRQRGQNQFALGDNSEDDQFQDGVMHIGRLLSQSSPAPVSIPQSEPSNDCLVESKLKAPAPPHSTQDSTVVVESAAESAQVVEVAPAYGIILVVEHAPTVEPSHTVDVTPVESTPALHKSTHPPTPAPEVINISSLMDAPAEPPAPAAAPLPPTPSIPTSGVRPLTPPSASTPATPSMSPVTPRSTARLPRRFNRPNPPTATKISTTIAPSSTLSVRSELIQEPAISEPMSLEMWRTSEAQAHAKLQLLAQSATVSSVQRSDGMGPSERRRRQLQQQKEAAKALIAKITREKEQSDRESSQTPAVELPPTLVPEIPIPTKPENTQPVVANVQGQPVVEYDDIIVVLPDGELVERVQEVLVWPNGDRVDVPEQLESVVQDGTPATQSADNDRNTQPVVEDPDISSDTWNHTPELEGGVQSCVNEHDHADVSDRSPDVDKGKGRMTEQEFAAAFIGHPESDIEDQSEVLSRWAMTPDEIAYNLAFPWRLHETVEWHTRSPSDEGYGTASDIQSPQSVRERASAPCSPVVHLRPQTQLPVDEGVSTSPMNKSLPHIGDTVAAAVVPTTESPIPTIFVIPPSPAIDTVAPEICPPKFVMSPSVGATLRLLASKNGTSSSSRGRQTRTKEIKPSRLNKRATKVKSAPALGRNSSVLQSSPGAARMDSHLRQSPFDTSEFSHIGQGGSALFCTPVTTPPFVLGDDRQGQDADMATDWDASLIKVSDVSAFVAQPLNAGISTSPHGMSAPSTTLDDFIALLAIESPIAFEFEDPGQATDSEAACQHVTELSDLSTSIPTIENLDASYFDIPNLSLSSFPSDSPFSNADTAADGCDSMLYNLDLLAYISTHGMPSSADAQEDLKAIEEFIDAALEAAAETESTPTATNVQGDPAFVNDRQEVTMPAVGHPSSPEPVLVSDHYDSHSEEDALVEVVVPRILKPAVKDDTQPECLQSTPMPAPLVATETTGEITRHDEAVLPRHPVADPEAISPADYIKAAEVPSVVEEQDEGVAEPMPTLHSKVAGASPVDPRVFALLSVIEPPKPAERHLRQVSRLHGRTTMIPASFHAAGGPFVQRDTKTQKRRARRLRRTRSIDSDASVNVWQTPRSPSSTLLEPFTSNTGFPDRRHTSRRAQSSTTRPMLPTPSRSLHTATAQHRSCRPMFSQKRRVYNTSSAFLSSPPSDDELSVASEVQSGSTIPPLGKQEKEDLLDGSRDSENIDIYLNEDAVPPFDLSLKLTLAFVAVRSVYVAVTWACSAVTALVS